MVLIILVILLLVSLITDIKSRKILNVITFPGIVFGFGYYLSTNGFEGFLYSGKGFLVGLGLLFIPFILGGMGAGDVKLMAAIGALMGVSFVFYSFIYTALIGGVIALILIIKANGLKTSITVFFYKFVFFRSNSGSLTQTVNKNSRLSFPYGVAIVLGAFCTLVWGGY